MIFFTLMLLGRTKFDGPVINVVFTPSLSSAIAISQTCFPLDSFDMYLTGSKYSLVGPVVTKAL